MLEYVLTNTQYYQDIADAIRRKKADVDKSLVSIAVTTPPNKTSYWSDEPVSYDGLVVTATYSNSSTQDVTSKCRFDFDSGDTLSEDTTVTIRYSYHKVAKTTTLNLTLIQLQSIAITTLPSKLTYQSGEAFSTAGMVVTATYTDGSTAVVTPRSTDPSNGSILRNTGVNQETKRITAYYTENDITKSAHTDYIVVIEPHYLTSISITTPPTKQTYEVGESLDLTGIEVKSHYNDGSVYSLGNGWTASPADGSVLNSAGTQTITISYTSRGITKTATTSVTVEEAATYVNGVKIVPWSTGTDAEIADMVTGAEQGKINLTDYWNVGDERTVHISEIPAKAVDSSGTNTLERQVEQDVILVLMDKDNSRYPYRNSYASGRIKPYFIVGAKNCLRGNGAISKNVPTYPTWSFTDREKYWASELLNAFPSYYKDNIFHEVTFKSGEYDSTTATYSSSKWFLPTEIEVFGIQKYSMTTESDLKQWEYYMTEENRKKKSTGSTLYSTWWLRSVYKNGGSSWVYVLTAGVVGGFAPYENTMGIAPCFAI